MTFETVSQEGRGMTATIKLTNWDTHHVVAAIADEVEGDFVKLFKLPKSQEKQACRKAAAKLRLMASRFDALAEAERPCNVATQKTINREVFR